MQSLTTTFSEKYKNCEAKFNEKMENKATNRAEMSSKRFIKARLQYLQRIVDKAGEATSLAACFALL